MGACCDSRDAAPQPGAKGKDIKAMSSAYAAEQLTKSAIEDQKERQRVEEIWAKFDVDGSGVLNREEGKAFLMQELENMTGQPPTDEEIERNFSIIDEDGNGSLDKEEVLKFLKGFGLGFTLRNLMRADTLQ